MDFTFREESQTITALPGVRSGALLRNADDRIRMFFAVRLRPVTRRRLLPESITITNPLLSSILVLRPREFL